MRSSGSLDAVDMLCFDVLFVFFMFVVFHLVLSAVPKKRGCEHRCFFEEVKKMFVEAHWIDWCFKAGLECIQCFHGSSRGRYTAVHGVS